MPTTTEQCLSRATATTFESLALLCPDMELTDSQRAAPLDVTVSVDYRGTHAGRLLLHGSASVASAVAANMLGVREVNDRATLGDALGELANVICGNLLPQLLGPEAVVKLAAPRVHTAGDIASRVQDRPSCTITLGVESGRVEVSLFAFQQRSRKSAA